MSSFDKKIKNRPSAPWKRPSAPDKRVSALAKANALAFPDMRLPSGKTLGEAYAEALAADDEQEADHE